MLEDCQDPEGLLMLVVLTPFSRDHEGLPAADPPGDGSAAV